MLILKCNRVISSPPCWDVSSILLLPTVFVGDHDMIEALKKNRTRDFGLSGEVNHFELLLQVFEIANLQEREMKLDLMRWNFFEEYYFFCNTLP
jgi:Protein of unknown function (DUF2764).